MKEPTAPARCAVPSRSPCVRSCRGRWPGVIVITGLRRARGRNFSIHQEPVFKASRKRVYEALTDAQQFDKVEKFSAEMQGGKSPGPRPTEIRRRVHGFRRTYCWQTSGVGAE